MSILNTNKSNIKIYFFILFLIFSIISSLFFYYKYKAKALKEKNLINTNYALLKNKENLVAVAIIGSGPAGLTASIYISRAGLKSCLFKGPDPYGQIIKSAGIENWPGAQKILGTELMENMDKQAILCGGTLINDVVVSVDFLNYPFTLKTEDGIKINALSVIICTGSEPKKLGISGEAEYWGKNISNCAICDASFYSDKTVVVVGGGDTAAEQVRELLMYAKKVYLLVRSSSMKAAIDLQNKYIKNEKVEVFYDVELVEIIGNSEKAEKVQILHKKSNKKEILLCDGIFFAVGVTPNTSLFKNQLKLDKRGYILVDNQTGQTSIKGVFAAGDVVSGEYGQAIIAAGNGSKAALSAVNFLYDTGFDLDLEKSMNSNFIENFSTQKNKIIDISTVEEFKQLVEDYDGVVFIEYYDNQCPACIKMLSVMTSVAEKMKNVRFLKIHRKYSYELKKIYMKNNFGLEIYEYPTMLLFKNGKFINQTNSILNRKELIDFIKNSIKNFK